MGPDVFLLNRFSHSGNLHCMMLFYVENLFSFNLCNAILLACVCHFSLIPEKTLFKSSPA